MNGLLLCLPNSNNVNYRLALFIGRSITMTYTFYFFLVFLPFLPFSILAVLAFGLGFLMLTPLALFTIHINALSKDYSFLKKSYSSLLLKSLIVGSLLVIPLCITIKYISYKKTLHHALAYIYSPDYSKTYSIDKDVSPISLAVKVTALQHSGIFLGLISY